MFVDQLQPKGWKQHLRTILFRVFLLSFIIIQTVNAQDDLILQNKTISTTVIYEAKNSITAGPDFNITSKGVVTFKSGNFITLKPGFVVEGGGEFYALTIGSPDAITENLFELPNEFALRQNYPNPFNPSTVISYQLAVNSDVELSIYNLLGQKVVRLVSERQRPGRYQVEWDASKHASGVYYYRLEAEGFVSTKKLVLLR